IDPPMQALVARYNKFQACRYGFDAMLADPQARCTVSVRDSLERLLECVSGDAAALGCTAQLLALQDMVRVGRGDAAWLRARAAAEGNLHDLTRAAAGCFALPSRYARPHALPTA
ncbi:MAG: hypothetical protein PHD22_13845, partial [Zoogloea sp.]|nr:hypothetical protein [Zoogloea sp.]